MGSHSGNCTVQSLLSNINKIGNRHHQIIGRVGKTVLCVVMVTLCLLTYVSSTGKQLHLSDHEQSATFFHLSICERNPIIRHLKSWSVGTWLNIESDEERWWKLADLSDVWKPFFYHLDPFVMFSKDEQKYFVKPLNSRDDCNVITLGIGHHIEGEKALLLKYPQCSYMAMDPEEDGNKQLVESLNGRYLRGAIGDKSGIYDGYFGMKGKYERNALMHIGFVNFTKEYNDNRPIDLLIVDIEGAEYGLLPVLHEQLRSLPPICQLNMELHAPPKKYGNMSIAEFTTMFTSFLLDGPYILLNVDRFDALQFHRLFFLNIQDRECIRKFICSQHN